MDAAERAEDAIAAVDARLRAAMADGRITPEEAHEVLALARAAVTEARDVVTSAERTSVAELAALSLLTTRPLNAHISKRLAAAGLVVTVIGHA
jgi:hypothetical protein